jgi:serine kinase of HPr protein (carbohydrate metabolism regulator)
MCAAHASCVSVGGAGVLIRGAAGAGKSHLVQLVLAAAAARHCFARLVADDRVLLARHGGRLVARPHPRLQGLLEVRGLGIVRLPHEPAAVVRLLVDIVPRSDMVRMPERADGTASLLGVELPRILVTDPGHAVVTVFQLLAMPTYPLVFAAQPANHARSLTPAARPCGVIGCFED